MTDVDHGRTIAEERPHPLTPVVQVWVWLVALVVFGARQLLEDPKSVTDLDVTRLPWPLLAFLVIGVGSLAWNLWEWWTTRFVVTDAELRVDNRGVQHRSRRVAYRRIQAVDISQPFAARLLGMAELMIDVGGDSSVRLRYLSKARAQQLRVFLMEHAALHQTDRTHGVDAPSEVEAIPPTGGTDETSLIRVPVGELVLGATLSHELMVMVILGLVSISVGVISGQGWLVGTGLVPIVLSVLGYFSSRVAGFYGFTLTQTATGLRLTRGLTSVSSQMIPVHRIQAVRIEEPLLWRLIGRARVALTLAGLRVGGEEVQATTVLLPIGRAADVRAALVAIWPDVDVDTIELLPSPTQTKWLAPLSWWAMRHGWDENTLILRRGWWTRETWVLPHARLQSASTHTDPLSRRLHLASVSIHAAGITSGPSVYLTEEHAVDFVFAEMRRAKAARAREAREASDRALTVMSAPADVQAPDR